MQSFANGFSDAFGHCLKQCGSFGAQFGSPSGSPQNSAMQSSTKRSVSLLSYRMVRSAPDFSNWTCTWLREVVGKMGLPCPKNCSRW